MHPILSIGTAMSAVVLAFATLVAPAIEQSIKADLKYCQQFPTECSPLGSPRYIHNNP